jgi:hypothetical protein
VDDRHVLVLARLEKGKLDVRVENVQPAAGKGYVSALNPEKRPIVQSGKLLTWALFIVPHNTLDVPGHRVAKAVLMSLQHADGPPQLVVDRWP